MAYRIDLFSDTMTKPTPAMREAIANAEVGDEQCGEDPTTNLLQERVAALLGKERALFLPTGTMCNQISFRVHCQQGDEIVLDENSHPRHFEAGGAAAMCGVQLYPLAGRRGVFTADQFRAAVRPTTLRNFPRTRCVSIEQTTNMGGGVAWPLAVMQEVAAAAREAGVAVHIDGARLMNAVVKTGVPAHAMGACADSVWLDLSKGLGCPVGAVLAGSAEFIDRAWRFKQMFGGAMRQSGVLAAAGLHALDHHVERLAEDHANAARLAQGLRECAQLTVEEPETNMVFFDVSRTGMTGAEFGARLRERGVRFSIVGAVRVRAVLHLDVSAAGVEEAIAEVRTVLNA